MLEDIHDDYLESVRNELKSRRDSLYNALKKIPGVAVHKPMGAFHGVV